MGTEIDGKVHRAAAPSDKIALSPDGFTTAQEVADLGTGGGGLLHLWDSYEDTIGVAVTAGVGGATLLPWVLNTAKHHDNLLDVSNPLEPTFASDGVYVVTVSTFLLAWVGGTGGSTKLVSFADAGDTVIYGLRNTILPEDVLSVNQNSVTWSRYMEAGTQMFAQVENNSDATMQLGLYAHVTKLGN